MYAKYTCIFMTVFAWRPHSSKATDIFGEFEDIIK